MTHIDGFFSSSLITGEDRVSKTTDEQMFEQGHHGSMRNTMIDAPGTFFLIVIHFERVVGWLNVFI